jgi:hypothetical protein
VDSYNNYGALWVKTDPNPDSICEFISDTKNVQRRIDHSFIIILMQVVNLFLDVPVGPCYLHSAGRSNECPDEDHSQACVSNITLWPHVSVCMCKDAN